MSAYPPNGSQPSASGIRHPPATDIRHKLVAILLPQGKHEPARQPRRILPGSRPLPAVLFELVYELVKLVERAHREWQANGTLGNEPRDIRRGLKGGGNPGARIDAVPLVTNPGKQAQPTLRLLQKENLDRFLGIPYSSLALIGIRPSSSLNASLAHVNQRSFVFHKWHDRSEQARSGPTGLAGELPLPCQTGLFVGFPPCQWNAIAPVSIRPLDKGRDVVGEAHTSVNAVIREPQHRKRLKQRGMVIDVANPL